MHLINSFSIKKKINTPVSFRIFADYSRVCRNWSDKPWYVPIVNKCLNLNAIILESPCGIGANWKYILRESSHVIHVACLLYVTLNLYFRLFLNFYVPCVKCQSDDVITTWINSLFVYIRQSMSHKSNKTKLECLNNRFLWIYCIMQICEETVANFCILPGWTLIAQKIFSTLLQ